MNILMIFRDDMKGKLIFYEEEDWRLRERKKLMKLVRNKILIVRKKRKSGEVRGDALRWVDSLMNFLKKEIELMIKWLRLLNSFLRKEKVI